MGKPTTPGTLPKLNDKQRAFVEHYLACWSGAEAARRAGYSKKTAYEQSYDLLRKPQIRAAIEERLKTLTMGADEVLVRLAEHAQASIADFLDDEVDFSLEQGRQHGKLHLIKKLKRTQRTEHSKDGDPITVTTVEVELHDAQSALVHLGRAHGLFVERTEHTGKSGGPIEVKDIEAIRAKRWADVAPVLASVEAADATESHD